MPKPCYVVFYNLALEGHVSTSILYWTHRPILIQCGRRLRRSVYQERSLGNIWEACHEISEERPSAFHRFDMKSLSNSQVNSLWRKTLRVQSLWKAFSFKLTLMCPVHMINHYRKYIRNVKTPLHKHSHYWANDGEVLWMQQESLNVLCFWEMWGFILGRKSC